MPCFLAASLLKLEIERGPGGGEPWPWPWRLARRGDRGDSESGEWGRVVGSFHSFLELKTSASPARNREIPSCLSGTASSTTSRPSSKSL